jgi:hypothetical protein
MVAGIASPNPSGIPGFNEAFIVNAGGVGVANSVPLKSWYNIVINVATANGAVQLPPAAPAMQVLVLNNSGQMPNTTAGTCTVFGNVNAEGEQDTIASATGVQGTTGVAVAPNAVGIFFVLTQQTGFTNEPLVGTWQYKVLA